MKVFITDQHRQLFKERGSIEFEALLSESRCQEWFSISKNLLKERDSLQNGCYLWRFDKRLRGFLQARHLGDIAFELTNTRPLRLGADSFLFNSFSSKTLVPSPLEDQTPYSGLVCGLLIRVKGSSQEDESGAIPQEVGSGVYLTPQAIIDYRTLLESQDDAFVLITYVTDIARYIHRSQDPHRHIDKKDGYASGDRLREFEHPILYR